MPEKMEQKTFRVKQIGDASEGVGEAVFATLGVKDHDGDVIMAGAFKEQSVALLPAHDARSVPLGKATIREDGKEAKARFEFNLNIQAAKDWYSALVFDQEKGQPIQEWSFRYNVLDGGYGEHEGEKVRFLKSLRVSEVSPVLEGAGINTRTLSVKDKKDTKPDDEAKASRLALSQFARNAMRYKSYADEGVG